MARAVGGRRAGLALAAVAVVFAVLPGIVRRTGDASRPAPALDPHPVACELPDLAFADSQGSTTGLAAFRGRVVLLNVWATWCEPCREEMPALDRLQALLGGPDFEVVALSIDEAGMTVVQPFLAHAGIRHLRPYVDSSGDARSRFAAGGVPLTLLIDRQGREVARHRGAAAWDHPDVLASVRALLEPRSARIDR